MRRRKFGFVEVTYATLDELCEVITDGTHQTPEYCEEGGFIFLSSKDVTTRKIDWDNVKYIPEDLHKKLYARLAPQKNDILLAKNGTTGVAAIVDRDEVFDIYVSLALLRPKTSIMPEYLLYAINSPVAKRQFDAGLKGIGVPNLHLSVIRKTRIAVHDMSKQKEICLLLDKVSNLLELRRTQLQELDTLIKARFVEMFGAIHESKIYPYAKIEELTTVISGGTPSREHPEYWDGGRIGWIKTTELQNSELYDSEERITELGMNNSSAKLVPENTILIAMYGQGKTRGMTAYLKFASTTNQACACILPSDEINSKYLWYYMIFSYEKLRGLAKGGNQPNLNGNMIKTFPVLMPDRVLQDEFVEFASQVDKSKFISFILSEKR